VRGWPLRRRIVVAAAVLVALGLLVAGLATTAALRGYLLREVDAELQQAARTWGAGGRGPGFDRDRAEQFRGPAAFYVVSLDPDGGDPVVLAEPAAAAEAPPDLPGWTLTDTIAGSGEPFTVGSAGPDWRVVAVPLRNGTGTLMFAASLAAVQATVAQLALLQLVIGAAVLLALVLIGRRLLVGGLRPLADVEQAAGAIAAGDLDRRAAVTDPGTEVGRLGASFNTMVAALQASLAAQAASEAAARRDEARMRQFVADASHELRTPLTSVRGYAELYRLGAARSPEQVADALGRIEGEAQRMGVLVEDLLLLARLDAERAFARDGLDLREVAQAAVESARAAWPDQAFRLVVPDAPVVVVGDADRLRQVVLNLLSNAQRHTTTGSMVDIRVAGEGHEALLAVRDHGPGVPPEQAERIFERFVRADASRARDDGGAGLGLAIVAAIVAGHAGTVVVGAPQDGGAGAVFTVRLPAGAAAAPGPR
jgi:two-component system OmpR family sensor kinase